MSIPWIVFISIVMVSIQSWIYRFWGIKKLSYTRHFSIPAVFPGEPLEMIEIITNRKLLPLPWLRLESMIPAALLFERQSNLEISEGQYYQNHKSLFYLSPYTKITRHHRIVCRHRGLYRLQSVTLTCGDFIGISPTTVPLKLDASLLVYPALVPVEDIPLPSHSWQGDVTVRRWIVSDPFLSAGVREYRPGDAMNRVNWKATARVGAIQVHNEDFTSNRRLMICVNFDLHEQMWDAVTEPETIEKALSYAASIAQLAISQGLEVGFCCNGYYADGEKKPVRIEPYSGSGHLYTLFAAMARLEVARSAQFLSLLEDDISGRVSQTDYLIMTAYMNEKLQSLAQRLRALGNSVGFLALATDKKRDAERWDAYA